MDVRVGRMDPAGRFCGLQPRCTGAPARLGTGYDTGPAVVGWRLVFLRISDARRLRSFTKMAAGPTTSESACGPSSRVLPAVLRRMGHRR